MFKLQNYKIYISEKNSDDSLLEGGAFGHMMHPYDDTSLTFANIKELIAMSLSGELDKEEQTTEKLDGQALAISYKNGNIIAARNKGDRKASGENALSVDDVISKFAGRGELSDAFSNAIKDLKSAVEKLSEKTLDDLFGEGKKFMHLEVVYPGTTNVVSYDSAKLIFHSITEYDEAGDAVNDDKKSAAKLQKLIKDINSDLQKTYHIAPPVAINLPRHIDFEAKRTYFLNKLSKIQKEAGIDDDASIRDYINFRFMELIDSEDKNSELDKVTINGLLQRWVQQDKSFNIKKLNVFVDDKQLRDKLITIDKKQEQYYKEFINPIELLILELGSVILKNASGFLAANPDTAVQKMRTEIERTQKEIENTKDVTKITKLKDQLAKIEAIGGFDSIVPTEGIVFTFNGKTYKFTGAFAPVNQILGMLKFI